MSSSLDMEDVYFHSLQEGACKFRKPREDLFYFFDFSNPAPSGGDLLHVYTAFKLVATTGGLGCFAGWAPESLVSARCGNSDCCRPY